MGRRENARYEANPAKATLLHAKHVLKLNDLAMDTLRSELWMLYWAYVHRNAESQLAGTGDGLAENPRSAARSQEEKQMLSSQVEKNMVSQAACSEVRAAQEHHRGTPGGAFREAGKRDMVSGARGYQPPR